MVRVEEVIFVISDADSGYGKRNTADSWSGERAGHECVADDGESPGNCSYESDHAFHHVSGE
jgi:hypothetical protein